MFKPQNNISFTKNHPWKQAFNDGFTKLYLNGKFSFFILMPFHCFSQPLMHLSLTLTLSSLSRLVSFHSLSSSLCLSLFAKVRNPLKPRSFLFLFVFLSSSKVLSLKCFYSCFYFCEGLGFWNFCIFSRSSFHYALSLVNLSESMLCHTTSLHCCFAVAMPPHFVS